MKKNPIKILSIYMLLLVVALVIILVASCADQGMVSATDPNSTDNTLSTQSTTTDLRIASSFTKTVGAPIDMARAKKWMRNYALANGRDFEYYISSDAIKAILAQANCNGISLRYGLDADNKLHIIPVGVDNKGTEMKSEKVAMDLGYISWDQAKALTNNYRGAVRSHYFGANTFDRLFKSGDCIIIKVTAALNDENQPQLLLTNASIIDGNTVEDDSSPCPATCETLQN